ncbi:hypothetical protein [Rhodopseudomonas palustris]|uniref:hypothetical protein n=1 Tax=Rhodopseudomonas palustris TaxID=1076 RepID=UPI0010576EF6|nr:hypothetical protein [Rhodopseudomonas palustris]
MLKRVGGLKGASELIDTKAEQIAKWRDGRTRPPFFALMTLVSAAKLDLNWLATGDAPPRRAAAVPADIDDELFGRVFEAVQRLYKDERVSLPPINLGRIAARKYGEISAATADPVERGVMIKLIVEQLRAEIRAAQAAPGTGKASA